jgi:hypothetical protein
METTSAPALPLRTPRGAETRYFGVLDRVHAGNRAQTLPFFVFTKGNKGRNVAFRGVALPSIEALPADDLVAVWKAAEGKRFQTTELCSAFWISRLPAIVDSGSSTRPAAD